MSFCFQGEFFGQNGHSRAPFEAPPIRLPEKHDYMVYFAISEYVFNTASWVYHQAGYMNFTIQNQHVSRGGRRLRGVVSGESGRLDWRPSLGVWGARERMYNLKPTKCGFKSRPWIPTVPIPQGSYERFC